MSGWHVGGRKSVNDSDSELFAFASLEHLVRSFTLRGGVCTLVAVVGAKTTHRAKAKSYFIRESDV
eukprot:945866-Prorocentrum_minimum.AAC.4